MCGGSERLSSPSEHPKGTVGRSLSSVPDIIYGQTTGWNNTNSCRLYLDLPMRWSAKYVSPTRRSDCCRRSSRPDSRRHCLRPLRHPPGACLDASSSSAGRYLGSVEAGSPRSQSSPLDQHGTNSDEPRHWSQSASWPWRSDRHNDTSCAHHSRHFQRACGIRSRSRISANQG
jgi:hypothetical protein